MRVFYYDIKMYYLKLLFNQKQDLFNEKPVNDYASHRHIVKSFGIDELLNETYFEIELTETGSCNIYVIKDKEFLLVRNHLGDHVALSTGKNQKYDPEIVHCFKTLVKYAFKYILNFDNHVQKKFNSKDYCFEVGKVGNLNLFKESFL